ncbi:MFS general substrate transporter [Aspergillus sclerotioniger CBS 115572]|uniref:MFS general substrate transporter n=1 Tax=Aspergillus sclerotioniger CBS 115572 TaxID=1450535 RepID=A0A317XFH1_9EURO|nr:MFS general substrate transporter [Aspergillus sclerotioniger CBS 115572]PWY96537.1 MFS general substrate transporter [Aspergillus sclerotioniger CBS 115572]
MAERVECTVPSTALPIISRDLKAGESYVWFVNALFLSSTAVQPLYGQLADVFGRRWPLISAVVFFALGSGISGGASSTAMLIAGRTIQGVGLGGVNMLIDVVVCDLVPLRERGQVTALIFIVFSHVTWRWSFYIGLPISGLTIVFMVLFLRVEYPKHTTFAEKLKRIDWLGNTVLVASVVAVLIALSFGGTSYNWSSWHVLVPLVVGFVGLIAFALVQVTPQLCPEPTMPPRLFANRISVAAFVISFLHGMLMYWQLYFLPVYFQGVQLSTSTRSGVQVLPTVIACVPAAIVAGGLVTKTSRYKPVQISGFTLIALSMGLFSLLDRTSSTGAWVGFQLLAAIGSGFIVTSTLPAAQAVLAEADVAALTATWAFCRAFGAVWGVSIPAAIFNNQFAARLRAQNYSTLTSLLQNTGNAYQEASREFVMQFPAAVQPIIIDAYTVALQRVWQISVVFAGLGFLIAWLEKEVELRTTLETEYGQEKKESLPEVEVVMPK